jgi:4-hydroxy-tetrahydrodipicolinate synthase
MNRFEGIWLPLVTPFRDGRLNLPAARALVRHYIAAGIHGLVVCGTTGEAATLDEDERLQLLDTVLEAADGRCPVVMGVSSNDTRDELRTLPPLNARPIAGLLVVAPYYTRPSQDGIRAHLTQIAVNTDHPIILYNILYRTGVNIELATVQALCAQPNIVAIKESGGDLNQLMNLIRDTRLQVLGGEDHLIFTTLCLGGHGAIAAAAHLRPQWYVAMFDAMRAGRIEVARELSYRLLPLIRALFSEPNPSAIKAALAQEGWISDEVRLPILPATARCRESLAVELAKLEQAPPK